jgi:hypothetical protein
MNLTLSAVHSQNAVLMRKARVNAWAVGVVANDSGEEACSHIIDAVTTSPSSYKKRNTPSALCGTVQPPARNVVSGNSEEISSKIVAHDKSERWGRSTSNKFRLQKQNDWILWINEGR